MNKNFQRTFSRSTQLSTIGLLLLKSALTTCLVILISHVCLAANNDVECASADKKSDLSLRQTPMGLRMTIHSAELSLYTQIAYGIDLGRLELVREVDGSPVINIMPDGFTAMAFAPTANRPDLIWTVVFTQALKFTATATATKSGVSLTDIQGHKTNIDLLCK